MCYCYGIFNLIWLFSFLTFWLVDYTKSIFFHLLSLRVMAQNLSDTKFHVIITSTSSFIIALSVELAMLGRYAKERMNIIEQYDHLSTEGK